MKMLKRFLSLGVIVPLPLPSQLANGQLADAGPVMANLNYIANQVNANVSPTSTYIAAGGVGGTANAITLTPAPAISAYTDGLTYTFLPTNANTGATTISVSGLSPIQLLDGAGASGALTGAELSTLYPVTVIYVLGQNAFRIISPYASFRASWSPSLTFGGTNTGMVVASSSGYLVKTGNIVFISAFISLSNKGSSVGSAAISGMPYQPDQTIAQSPIFNMTSSVVTFSAGYNCGIFAGPSSIQLMNQVTSGALSNLLNSAFANNSSLTLAGMYAV
jgi:hypothetical protein